MEWGAPRSVSLEVGIPASIMSVEPSLQLKTVKAGFVGRAAAVFRVTRIHVYVDRAEAWRDAETLRKLLEYLVTPPYLRRLVYPRDVPELRYAGVLPPLQIPTHGVGGPREGEVREALVLRRRGRFVTLEAGLGEEVEARLPPGFEARRGDRVYIRIVSLDPLRVEIVGEPGVYTGYRVELHDNLSELLRRAKNALIVATSRRGRDVREVLGEVSGKAKEKGRVVTLFGSPSEGLYEIAERENLKLDEVVDYVVNTVPGQGTLTVRTEEALWATLSVLNLHLP